MSRVPESLQHEPHLVSGAPSALLIAEHLESLHALESERQFTDLGNPELPTFDRKVEIMDAMVGKQVLILVSPTGTGKSSQLPQFALEAGFTRIIESQPRRKATQNIHDRVKSEVGAVVGEDQASELVSYQTGAGLFGSAEAPIQIVTDGILVAREAHNPSNGDNEMWILDEIHEGNQNQWLLLGLAKQKLAENPRFTVVVTTATADKYKLISYFTDEDGNEPAVIELDARMYEIEDREEPYSNTIKEVLKAAKDIHENPDAHDGSNTIVLFEAGKAEIKDAIDEIRAKLPPEILAKTTVLSGHAKMTPEALAPIYEPADGIKIVVQTNMGKTSMTIPDTRYVITSGLERQIEIDEEGVPALVEYPSSQDCLMQERGRAGRTNTGIFIHTRRPGRPFISKQDRDPHLTPEIKRTSIDRIALYLASIGESIIDFDGIDEIVDISKARALSRNRALGALDGNGQITALGRRMIKYPLSPERARSMVETEKHGAEIRLYMAALTAAAEAGGLRLFEPGGSRNWEKLSDEASSDALAQLDIFVALQDMSLGDMHHFDIDTNNYLRAEEQFRKVAKRAGIDQIPKLLPPSQAERDILRECIAAGYINSVYLPYGEGLFKKLGNEMLTPRELSNRSVVLEMTPSAVVGDPRNVVIYKNGSEQTKRIIEEVTEVPTSVIGRLAVHLTEWMPTGFKLRGGKFVQTEEQVLGVIALGKREVPAEPSPQLRAAVIEYVKALPGKNLKELYKIKSELERLAHRAKQPTPRLTEDKINEYINRAAPETVKDPSHVEENLRQIIEAEDITLDSFLSAKERAKIMRNSPDEITIGDMYLKLRYQQGRVFVKKFKPAMIAVLDDTKQLELPDGREIRFIYDTRKYTLQQLKTLLREQGLI